MQLELLEDPQTRRTRFSTIAELIDQAARVQPDADAICEETGLRMSYTDLREAVRRFAADLATLLPEVAPRRPRVALVLPNGAGMAVALLGTAILGEAAPLNPRLKAAEYIEHYATSRIDAVLVPALYDGPAVAAAYQLDIPVFRLKDDRRLVGAPKDTPATIPTPTPDDIALVLVTSGSTGKPKVVPLTHRNVCRSAADVAASVALSPTDLCLVMWEQFHIGGLVDLLLAPLASGGSILTTPDFDAASVFRLLESHRPTWFQAVPTTLGELVHVAGRDGVVPVVGRLRFLRSVAAALTPDLQAKVVALFGVPVIRTLGMTEAGPLITSTALPPAPQKPGSVGKPAGPDVSILDDEGNGVPHCSVGQVAIRGENVFAGYENDTAANCRSFVAGWFLTGDLGRFDEDGDLFLVGRRKEVINRGGEKVNPLEVDEALQAHPAVIAAASFPVSHPTLGEDVAAAVVLSRPIEMGDIRAFLVERLSLYKVPARIFVLESLPKTHVGKIDRPELARVFRESAARPQGVKEPRSATERLLAKIWQKELSLGHIGVDQDFVALGGDSLSTMRAFLALEEALGVRLPDALLENFSTISEICAILDRKGITTSSLEGAVGTFEAEDEPAPSSTLGTESFAGGPLKFGYAVETCTSLQSLRILENQLTSYATPAEIALALLPLTGDTVGRRADLPEAEASSLKRRFSRWRKEVESDLRNAVETARWQRTEISEAAINYRDPTTNAGRKTLIVGFTGNIMRLMLPTYRILACLDPEEFELVLLRDPNNARFARGLPGCGSDIGAVASFVDRLVIEGGYPRAIALGTSGGGVAAICCALVLGLPKAVSVSPAGLAHRPELLDELRSLALDGTQGTRVVIAHGSNARDSDSALQLLDFLPTAEIFANPTYRKHNILAEAHRAGALPDLLFEWLR